MTRSAMNRTFVCQITQHKFLILVKCVIKIVFEQQDHDYGIYVIYSHVA